MATAVPRGGLPLDAVAGASFLAQVLLANSPASTIGWLVGATAQTLADANKRGWFGD